MGRDLTTIQRRFGLVSQKIQLLIIVKKFINVMAAHCLFESSKAKHKRKREKDVPFSARLLSIDFRLCWPLFPPSSLLFFPFVLSLVLPFFLSPPLPSCPSLVPLLVQSQPHSFRLCQNLYTNPNQPSWSFILSHAVSCGSLWGPHGDLRPT